MSGGGGTGYCGTQEDMKGRKKSVVRKGRRTIDAYAPTKRRKSETGGGVLSSHI